MQLAQVAATIPNLPNFDELETIVRDSLFGDWIVRIEHAAGDPKKDILWERWGEALFAVKDPSQVLDAITACRANHPTHEIRLHAEKVKPETRLIFTVYRPQEQITPTKKIAPISTLPVVANTKPWSAPATHAIGGRVWRYVAVAATVFAVVLLLEDSALAGQIAAEFAK
jgi:ribulose bisphosphate carboxylase small subunit